MSKFPVPGMSRTRATASLRRPVVIFAAVVATYDSSSFFLGRWTCASGGSSSRWSSSPSSWQWSSGPPMPWSCVPSASWRRTSWRGTWRRSSPWSSVWRRASSPPACPAWGPSPPSGWARLLLGEAFPDGRLAERVRHRLLGLVRVLGAGDDVQLLDHRTAEAVLREHAAHGLLDHPLRLGGEQCVVARPRDATGVAGVPIRDLLGFLATGHLDLRRVDDDDVVADVHVGREDRFVLAAEDGRDLRGQASENQAAGIDHVPAAHDVLGLRRVGLHTWEIGRASRPMGNATCGNVTPSKLARLTTGRRSPDASRRTRVRA